MNVFIRTFGCSLNQADSIIMENLLKKEGLKIVKSARNAGIIIINTCAVKEPTENKIVRYISEIPGNKKVIIAGCLTRTRTKLLKEKFNHSLIGCDNLKDAIKAVKGDVKESLKREKMCKVGVVPIQKNKVIEIIPVCEGCLGECSYCATRMARGELYSYSEDNIIKHLNDALQRGVKEFWLTAQDTGAYGLDINTNIIKLLQKIVRLNSWFKVRIGMMNPSHAYKARKELGGLLINPKIFRFIHVPVQSGSNKILKLMKRNYTSEEFAEACNYLRSKVKDLTISTDIIIGFPGESEKDFLQTIKLIFEVKPEIVNVSRYWKRENTPASRMKQLAPDIVKRRVREFMKIYNQMKNEKTPN